MRLNPRQIEAFRAVMQTGGVTAAATALQVTQPAVSRLIRDFERDSDLVLFNREGNRLVPRQEAHTLWSEIERVYVGLDHIGRIADGIRRGRGDTLRIGAVAALTTRCMDRVLAKFLAAFPKSAVTFETESSGRIADLVAMQYYDVGLVYAHGGHSSARGETIATREAVCAVPLSHRLARRNAVAAADLAGETLALPGRRTALRATIDEALAAKPVRPGRVIEASLHNCCRIVAQNLALAIVDPLSAEEFADKLAIKPFRPALEIVYGVMFAHGPARNHLARDFIDMLRGDLSANA